MKSAVNILKANDWLYWTYAKFMYGTQKYRDSTFEASKIIDNLWLGGITSTCNKEELMERNIQLIVTAVYGASANFPYDFEYERANLKDIESEDILEEIERVLPEIHNALQEGKGVLVSCIQGRSRSASFVIAYLMRYRDMTLDAALKFVKDRRSQVDPNEGYLKQLKYFELYNFSTKA